MGSAQHLSRMINDLLELAKVEAGKQEFCPEPVVLGDLIEEVRSALEPAALQKRIALRTVLDPSLQVVTLDRACLKLVLFNYLSNAVEFTPHDGQVVILRGAKRGTGLMRTRVATRRMYNAAHNVVTVPGEPIENLVSFARKRLGVLKAGTPHIPEHLSLRLTLSAKIGIRRRQKGCSG